MKIGMIGRWLACAGLCTLILSGSGCVVGEDSADFPNSRSETWRFLNHATFGPTEADVARIDSIGYSAWLDEQFAMQSDTTARAFLEQRDAELKVDEPANKSRADQIVEGFYTRALTDPAQLRQRVVFALSEIFVVSLNNPELNPRPSFVAGYIDTLNANAFSDYRTLLEAVTKSPAMGIYLSFRANQKEDDAIGRVPDENYAREVMQLFSIGLHELNMDGTPVMGSNGLPKPSYTSEDVQGLAKIFTGWSFYRGPAFSSQTELDCFNGNTSCQDPEGAYRPMVAYPAYHSTSATSFLNVTVPARSGSDPQADLKIALDTLAKHKNVAPFFCRQLIQRLVTSNPSPEYVGRVAQKFVDTNGSLKEVVKAILLDADALGSPYQTWSTDGKLREPVLRLTALLRAFTFDGPGLKASTGRVKTAGITSTADASLSFGQQPWNSPSVFNFFRPGYVPPQSNSAAKGMVVPEMQIASEISVTGYVNSVLSLLNNGIGKVNNQAGVRLVLTEQRPLAKNPQDLVNDVNNRLIGGIMTPALQKDILAALETIPVPALNEAGSNTADINAALDKRVNAAILMTAVSTEFLIQK
ncbi:DUF1800 domain-containing protein [Aquabacterium sp.]|uniref:DUF1800 domain-containing protein n=1 Tax=Aquabacterium sp. TaxID=1872578 RepID=UPI003D6D40DC